MTHDTQVRTIQVIVTSREAMEQRLEAAEQALIAVAKTDRQEGILITRHGPGTFTVSLNPAVLYGLTRETVT